VCSKCHRYRYIERRSGALDIKRKGLETFVEAAKYLPNLKFVVVGPHYDNSIRKLKSIASGNVKFTGFVPDEELIKYYQKAKYIVNEI